MYFGLLIDCFTGFSDEDFDGLDSDKDLNSDDDKTNDKNLDLMTAILEQRYVCTFVFADIYYWTNFNF